MGQWWTAEDDARLLLDPTDEALAMNRAGDIVREYGILSIAQAIWNDPRRAMPWSDPAYWRRPQQEVARETSTFEKIAETSSHVAGCIAFASPIGAPGCTCTEGIRRMASAMDRRAHPREAPGTPRFDDIPPGSV